MFIKVLQKNVDYERMYIVVENLIRRVNKNRISTYLVHIQFSVMLHFPQKCTEICFGLLPFNCCQLSAYFLDILLRTP